MNYYYFHFHTRVTFALLSSIQDARACCQRLKSYASPVPPMQVLGWSLSLLSDFRLVLAKLPVRRSVFFVAFDFDGEIGHETFGLAQEPRVDGFAFRLARVLLDPYGVPTVKVGRFSPRDLFVRVLGPEESLFFVSIRKVAKFGGPEKSRFFPCHRS